jgi:hypothetical protein
MRRFYFSIVRTAGTGVKPAVKTRGIPILLGVTLTVLPSTCFLWFLLAGDLATDANTLKALLINLAATLLIGGGIGLGTSFIFPNKWLLVVGTQLGWFGGLLGTALIGEMIPITRYNPLPSYEGFALLICCGLVAGLFPAVFARLWKMAG